MDNMAWWFNESDVAEARARYEQWIKEARERGRRERIRRRIYAALIGAAVLAAVFGGLVFVNKATAAPCVPSMGSAVRGTCPESTSRVEPKQTPKIETREPAGSPRSGMRLSEMKAKCEQTGGHWLQEDGDERMPNHMIIGCLFAVPKGAK